MHFLSDSTLSVWLVFWGFFFTKREYLACIILWFSLRLIYKLRCDNHHLSLPPCLDGSAMSVPHTLP